MVDAITRTMGLDCGFDAYAVIETKVGEAVNEHFDSVPYYSVHPSVGGSSARIEFYPGRAFDGSPVGTPTIFAFDRDQVIPMHNAKNPNVIDSICLRDAGRHFPMMNVHGPQHGVSNIADVVRVVAIEMAVKDASVPSAYFANANI